MLVVHITVAEVAVTADTETPLITTMGSGVPPPPLPLQPARPAKQSKLAIINMFLRSKDSFALRNHMPDHKFVSAAPGLPDKIEECF